MPAVWSKPAFGVSVTIAGDVIIEVRVLGSAEYPEGRSTTREFREEASTFRMGRRPTRGVAFDHTCREADAQSPPPSLVVRVWRMRSLVMRASRMWRRAVRSVSGSSLMPASWSPWRAQVGVRKEGGSTRLRRERAEFLYFGSPGTVLLRFIDPCGYTIFNRIQCGELYDEWIAANQNIETDDAQRWASDVAALIPRCAD